jgi:hypothetical protein
MVNLDPIAQYHGKDEIMFSSRAASLTAAGYNSMPMWAHYANNHQGFCVAYDMKEEDNKELAVCILPIQYTDRRIEITDIMVKHIDFVLKEKQRQMSQGRKRIIIDDLMIAYTTVFLQNIKQSSWQYEKEFRCSAGRTSIGMPFMKAMPTGIYVGEKCSSVHVERLCNIASDLGVPIYKLEFKDINNSYQLEPKKMM